jgi:hypothetical protein
MVRVLMVLVAVVVPALARAQGVGEVLLVSDRMNPNTVNAFECDPANDAKVVVRWNPQLINGYTSVPVAGSYIVYGSNTAPMGTGGAATQCPILNKIPPNNILVGTVLDTTISPAPGATTGTISLPALLTAAGFPAFSGCPADSTTIFLCVQGVLGDANIVTTNFAIAWAMVTVSTSIPKIPAITGITPGDGALDVAWEPDAAGTGTAVTRQVEIEVTPVASTTDVFDAGGTRTVGTFGASPARVDGLVNGVVYDVRARALSGAANVSDFSPAGVTTGMPQALAGPPPSPPLAGSGGGCSSGLSGPLGLAILAGALALARAGRRR